MLRIYILSTNPLRQAYSVSFAEAISYIDVSPNPDQEVVKDMLTAFKEDEKADIKMMEGRPE